MTMSDAQAFSTLATCFMPVDSATWERTVQPTAWAEFLDRTRCLMQEGRPFGAPCPPVKTARNCRPLSEFLNEREVRALFTPPTYEEKERFAARHFTGGLPGSAMPIESLYTMWAPRASGAAFAGKTGLYRSDVALYLTDLARSLGLELSPEASAHPDHLAVELELTSYLIDEGLHTEAQQFWLERSAWLADFRAKLRALGDEALFYLALTDALLAIRENCLVQTIEREKAVTAYA